MVIRGHRREDPKSGTGKKARPAERESEVRRRSGQLTMSLACRQKLELTIMGASCSSR
jgi:hypothetical protein